MRARISCGWVVTSRPRTRIRPAVGAMKPSSDLIIVLLPAPLGPRRPTAPIGKLALTSLSALFFPYSTVTPSSETAAAGGAPASGGAGDGDPPGRPGG